ncbi:uncharacterized protein [Solanum lycopersicum]|uniref:uncharacterized protein isoform X2 n=1 Tax=Solanum lycopersicum TaxID=4081 RepID=UPI003749D920
MKAPLCFPSCLAFIVPFCDGISRSFAVYAFVLFWHLCVIVRGSAYNSNSWTNGELMPYTGFIEEQITKCCFIAEVDLVSSTLHRGISSFFS